MIDPIDFNEEEVLIEVRKHWFIFLLEGISLGLVAILPASLPFVKTLVPDLTITLGWFYVFAYSLWLMILWIVFFIIWTDFYLDIWIVTPTKIIDIEQRGLFNREVATCQIVKVQDVVAEVPGIFAMLLDFGNLRLQTAGGQGEFVFKGAKSPQKVKEKIMKIQKESLILKDGLI